MARTPAAPARRCRRRATTGPTVWMMWRAFKSVAARHLGVAGLAAAEEAALVDQLRAGRAMDGAVDAAAAEQRRVGRVDDGVDLERRDVALPDARPHGHFDISTQASPCTRHRLRGRERVRRPRRNRRPCAAPRMPAPVSCASTSRVIGCQPVTAPLVDDRLLRAHEHERAHRHAVGVDGDRAAGDERAVLAAARLRHAAKEDEVRVAPPVDVEVGRMRREVGARLRIARLRATAAPVPPAASRRRCSSLDTF